VAAEVRRLSRHWELKLAALILSFALWVFVMTSEKAEVVLAAPVELDAIPPGLEVVGERPDSVDVQLHGLRAILARVGPEQVRARVSLAGARPGEVVLRLVPDQITAPSGVTVLRVSPSRLRVTLEARRADVRP
jgi:YbbR-like protein